MLMDIRCSTEVSIKIHLKFDDGSKKNRLVSKDDLIEISFNQNGLMKRVEGKVIKINAIDSDSRRWYLIVDGSGDFESEQYKIQVMNILDLDIIRKADSVRYIETTNDCTAIQGFRIVNGRLQYTLDGFNWKFVRTDPRYIMKGDPDCCDPGFGGYGEGYTDFHDNSFGIKDEQI